MSSQQQGNTGGSYGGSGTKSDLDNHGNQCNPNNPEHKGYDSSFKGTKSDANNHANQLNPNHPSYKAPKK